MTPQPHSLLAAARQTAEILGMPWADFFKYYRDLQIEPTFDEKGNQTSPHNWLPKSQGRNIWAAHPNYIARLLCAIGGTEQPGLARAAVDWTRDLTPNGRQMHITELPAANVPAPIEEVFFRYLVDPQAASELANVEFRPDELTVIFNLKSGQPIVYARHNKHGEGRSDPPQRYNGISRRGVIDGLVFVFLARAVVWRRSDQSPLNKGEENDPDANQA